MSRGLTGWCPPPAPQGFPEQGRPLWGAVRQHLPQRSEAACEWGKSSRPPPRSFLSLDVSDGGHAVTEVSLWFRVQCHTSGVCRLRSSPLGPLARGRSGSLGLGLPPRLSPEALAGCSLPVVGGGRVRPRPGLCRLSGVKAPRTRLLPGCEMPKVARRLPRSARVWCMRPARSASTSSTCCPSPRPSTASTGSGHCGPPA